MDRGRAGKEWTHINSLVSLRCLRDKSVHHLGREYVLRGLSAALSVLALSHALLRHRLNGDLCCLLGTSIARFLS